MHPKIQNLLGITISLFLLVLTLTAGGGLLILNGAYNASDLNQISVSAEAKVAGTPDIAKFTYSIKTEGGTEVAEVQQETASKSNAVIAAIKDLGVAEEDIKTSSYSVDPRYQYFKCNEETGECPPAEIIGYNSNQRVTVTMRDFDQVGKILAAAVDNGATEISQLSYEIEDPTEFRNQAREEAIKKAKTKAESLAEAGDFRLGKLVGINDSESGARGDFEVMALSSKAYLDDAVEEFIPSQPGTQDVSVSVSLTYKIK